MENGVDDLKKMSSHQLLDLRQTLEKARDDKLTQLKQLEVEFKATIERLKRVQTAYYKTLQEEEAGSKQKLEANRLAQGARRATYIWNAVGIFQFCEMSPFAFLMGVFNASGIDCFNLNQRAVFREILFNTRYRKFLK